MTVLETDLNWEAAVKVMAAGGAVNRPHWDPPCAAMLHDGKVVVVNAAGLIIHDFVDPPETHDAEPWQSVKLDT